jgi:hypothetical protein
MQPVTNPLKAVASRLDGLGRGMQGTADDVLVVSIL